MKKINDDIIFRIAIFLLPFENFFFAPSSGWAALTPVVLFFYLLFNIREVFVCIKKHNKIVLFFVLAFGLALVNKKPSIEKDLIVDEATATEEVSTTETTESADWWNESETTDAAATEEKAE